MESSTKLRVKARQKEDVTSTLTNDGSTRFLRCNKQSKCHHRSGQKVIKFVNFQPEKSTL
jgi:hypothetical protein